MSKYILILILALAMVLAACSAIKPETPDQVTTNEPVETENDSATPTQAISATNTATNPPVPTATSEGSDQTSNTEKIGISDPMQCELIDLLPPMDPSQQAIFDPINPPWAKGADDAGVTIIEYSDFQ